MDVLDFKNEASRFLLSKGKLLIAEPFLNDPNFKRSVVLLCEHSDDGSLGFVLNNKSKYLVSDLLLDCPYSLLPVYEGGPVQLNTLHFIHTVPHLLEGTEIIKDIYWGSNYELLASRLNANMINASDIRLFLGYSGWSAGQLKQECDDGAWLGVDANANIVFNTENQEAWKQAIGLLGNKFKFLANIPLNPQLN
jgi:putative transcriptional regulator